MIHENEEFNVDSILNPENISPKMLFDLKQETYGKKKGLDKLKEKTKLLEQSIKDVTIDEKLMDGYMIIGICHLTIRAYEKAIEVLNLVKPKKRASFYIGKCYQGQCKFKKAIEAFELAISKNPAEYDAQIEIAVSKRNLNDAKGALEIIKPILKENSTNPELHYQFGHCSDDLGEKDVAMDAYEQALELDPDHPHALFRMAYVYDREQMDDEAIELYEQCNSLPVKHINSYLNLGILYEDKEEYEKAMTCYDAVLQTDPNNPRARMYLKDAKVSLNMYYDENTSKKQNKESDVLSIPISDFELSVRSRNCLEKMFINTLGDLTKVSEHDLLSYKNFGETSLYEIRHILKQKGLRLGQALEKSSGGSLGDNFGSTTDSEPADPDSETAEPLETEDTIETTANEHIEPGETMDSSLEPDDDQLEEMEPAEEEIAKI